MAPEEFHKILRQAANRAKRHRPPWLDTQDLTQAAELAMIEARARGRVETITDPKHLENKIRQRVFGAMLDEIRRSMDGTRDNHQPAPLPMPEDANGEQLDTFAAPDDPVRTLQLKKAVQRFARKGTAKQHEAVTLRAAGYSLVEIGQVLDVSESRASQLLKESRDIMSVWGDL